MSAGIPWIIFDADNTPWTVEELYDRAQEQLVANLVTRGEKVSVVDLFQRIRDKELYETYGYSACRFARSFEDTLLHFQPKSLAADVRRARLLALSVFEQRAEAAVGLEELLVALEAKYHLAILTAGEQWVQERRLNDFHLRHRFAAVEIVESKTPAVFEAICERHRVARHESWVVGDSLSSDIQPALAAGLRAVFLAASNWDRENHGELIPDGVARINRLHELAGVPGVL